MYTLIGRVHGANGRRVTSGSSTDICRKIKIKLKLKDFLGIHFLFVFGFVPTCIEPTYSSAKPEHD